MNIEKKICSRGERRNDVVIGFYHAFILNVGRISVI